MAIGVAKGYFPIYFVGAAAPEFRDRSEMVANGSELEQRFQRSLTRQVTTASRSLAKVG